MPERYGQYADATLGKRIFEMFGSKSTGFYIDLGAAHPWVCSNTAYLNEQGWYGILVEPNVHFIELLEKHRPDDILVKAAIWDRDGDAAFNTGEIGSALVESGFRCHACYNAIMSTPIMTMKTFLENYRDIIPKYIEYISLDIQGGEIHCYKDLPLAKVISIEIHKPEWVPEILSHFKKKRYKIEHLGDGDYLFIKQSIFERIKGWFKEKYDVLRSGAQVVFAKVRGLWKRRHGSTN